MKQPDIKLAREKLEWGLKTGLNEGIHKTLDYFEKIL